ncbi:MAG: hypothetical protein ABIJ97_16365 [Bacteroidota bacterium]
MELKWIDEAEHRQLIKENEVKEENHFDNIIINDNHKKLLPFISRLVEIIERINRISPNERKPSMEVGHTYLSGDDHYEFYGSAHLMQNKRVAIFFSKKNMYMAWRRIFFKIPEEHGKIKIVVYEKLTSQTNSKDNKKKRMKFKFQIDDLNDIILGKMIDWLVYRINYPELKKYLPKDHY